MKLFKFLSLGAFSANAWTLLDPVYDQMASLIMSQVTTMFESVQGELAVAGDLTPVFDEFITKFKNIDNADVVRILKSVDIELLMDGGLTPEDLVEIFAEEIDNPNSEFYGMNLDAIGDEFTASLDPAHIEPFNNALLAMTESASVFQDLYNGDVNLHNIVGSFADIMDAALSLNDIYSFAESDTLTQVLFYSSIVVEKGLFVVEEWKEYLYMYEDAVDLTMNEYSRRVVDADEQFCNGDLGFIKSVQEKLKFVPNVVIDNWTTPVKKSAEIYNQLVANVPVVENYALSDTLLDTMIDQLDVVMSSVDGTLTEVYAMTLPFAGQINTAARGYFC